MTISRCSRCVMPTIVERGLGARPGHAVAVIMGATQPGGIGDAKGETTTPARAVPR